MIIPLHVEFENFLSFQKFQKFDFQTKGVHYIYGINHDADIDNNDFTADSYNVGVGKSSLALALQYAFYGDIQRKVNKDQIINKSSKKNLYVGMDFEVTSTGDKFRIKRYRKHDEFKNRLFLLKWNGKKWEDISGVDLTQTQEFIDKIIVLDIRTFEKTSLLTREDKFQFLELPTLNRGMIFENISQINKFKDYWIKAKSRLKHYEEEMVDISNDILKETTIIKRDKKYIEEIKESDEEKKEELQNEIDDLQLELNEIISSDMSFQDLLTKISEFRELDKKGEALNKTIADCFKEQDIYELEEKSLKRDVKDLEEEFAESKSEVDDFKPKKCHNCGAIQEQEVYEQEYKKLVKSRDSLEERLKKKQTLLIDVQKKLNDAVETRKQADRDLNDLSVTITRHELPDFIKEAICNGDEETITNLKNINTNINTKKSILASINSSAQIAQLEIEIKDHLRSLKKHVEKKEANLKQQSIYQFWLNVLDFKSENSLKQFVITQIIPLFNNFVQQMIDVVYKGNLIIIFDNFFNETIYYQSEEWKYDELSTGEKMKLNFCINLAIFDLTRVNLDSCGVIFFDEIFTNADTPTVIACLDIIRERYAANSGIYIISHDEKVKNNLRPDSFIRIEKKDKCSEIFFEENNSCMLI